MTRKVKILISVIGIVAILAVAGLAVALGITENNRRKTQGRLDSIYQKSYFETMDSMSDIELKLAKINALSGKSLKQQLLNDVWRECDIAATNLSQLGVETEELSNIIKFLNQLGDYCMFLSMKLKSGSIGEAEQANLVKSYDIIKQLNTGLIGAQDKLISGDKIDVGILSDGNLISDAIKDYSSVEYPEMIYDGPFSDGLSDRETKFLTGKTEISVERGQELIKTYFPDATDIKHVGEGSSSIPTYLYEFTLGRNTGTAQITKIGGYLAMYNAYCVIDDPQLTEEECIQKADEYLARFGYENMKAVWVCNNNSTVYINYASVKDGMVLYPDLIKIKICSQTGDVIGLEAQNYLYNHVERDLTVPTRQATVGENLTVESRTFCLIPTEWNTEIVAEEVVATMGDITYYIYYDTESGEELRVFVVIDEEGKLLI